MQQLETVAVEGEDQPFADEARIGFEEHRDAIARRSAPKALPIGGANGIWTISVRKRVIFMVHPSAALQR